jgi:hypothetical protein
VHLRTGTALWLGQRDAVQALGTVLEVHEDVAGAVGYRQRRGSGTLVIVGGGTAHGVAISAPAAAASARQRVVSVAGGVLEAAGRVRSPFRAGGARAPRAWFVEPPHMHVSMLWLPRSAKVPNIGDQWPCEIRMTTASFDSVSFA